MKILIDSDQILEFYKVLEFISTKCVSDLGRSRLLNNKPLDDYQQLSTILKEVSEAKEIYVSEGGMPIWSFDDIRSLLNKIEPLDSYLEIADCQKVQNFLEVSASVHKYFQKREENSKELKNYADKIDSLPNVLKLIQNTIDPSGAIYDNASPDLKKIRAQISIVSKQIHTKLERILRKQTEHIQDDYITLRDGRLVIPVREFSVNKIPGIVHGQSSTGQTHYVEPMPVVPLNNEIFELYNQEKREIVRILKRLSQNFREHKETLILNQENLIHLDSIQAKAQYSISVDGRAPIINEPFSWDIRNGYHPLLLKKIGKETIPLNMEIGTDFRMMVITGPNAGGKTVTLKTIGLLQILFQCGFHIPVAEGSKFPICHQIAAVIGDEQSIEDDLSTFSSHVKKLNDIIYHLAHRSLLLVDEIGTGTDPAEGSALAISLLEEFNREGVVTLVTTHLSELKAFAHKLDGAMNAAMQFDFKSLSPLFKLEIGMPGSSYAFDISQRLGLNEKVLKRARDLLGTSHHELDSMINDLTKKRQDIEEKIRELSLKESEMEGLKALYKTRSEDLKKNRKKYEKESFNEAKAILDNVNKTIENVIREIRESQADSRTIKKGRDELKELSDKINQLVDRPESQKIDLDNLRPGFSIKSKRFSVTGQITKILKEKKQVEIDAGGVKMKIPVEDIILDKSIATKISAEIDIKDSSPNIINEIDLRGKIAEDALIELEQYLDHALNSHWKEVRIIHGKGTGALRASVHAFLKKHKKVQAYRLGNYGEGDTGVTVIEL
jgi:DNA mismatch repair protein MutS2